jgi:hypothetical protein
MNNKKIYSIDLKEKNDNKLISKLKKFNLGQLEDLRDDALDKVYYFEGNAKYRIDKYKPRPDIDKKLIKECLVASAILTVAAVGLSFPEPDVFSIIIASLAAGASLGTVVFEALGKFDGIYNKINKQVIKSFNRKEIRNQRLVDAIDTVVAGRNTKRQEL